VELKRYKIFNKELRKVVILSSFYFLYFNLLGQLEEFTISYKFNISTTDNSFNLNEVAEFPAGGYVIGGNSKVPSTRNIIIILLNEDLSVEWAREIDTGEEDFFEDIAVDEVGNIYVNMGSRFSNNANINISTNLLKISNSGDFIWGRTLQTTSNTLVNTIEIMNDNSVSICADDLDFTNYGIASMITNITSAGDLKFSRVYARSERDFLRSSHLALDDGSYYLVSQNFPQLNINLSKINANGDFIWGKTYETNATLQIIGNFTSVISSPLIYNNELYFSAYSDDLGGVEKDWIFKTDLEGNLKKAVSLTDNNLNSVFVKSSNDEPFINPIRNTFSSVITDGTSYLIELDTSFNEINTYSYGDELNGFSNFYLNGNEDGILRFGFIEDLSLPNPVVATFGLTPIEGDCFLEEDEEELFQINDETAIIKINSFTADITNFTIGDFQPLVFRPIELIDKQVSCPDEEDPDSLNDDEVTDVNIYRKYSPNNDGLNDCLYISGLEEFHNNKITLFDEIGEQVFFKENYENDTYCFEELENGIYYLHLDLNSGEEIV